ncbi:MAG: LCP family protein [Coriobacteriales bacterium]|nr:LCP family protein [Coriobacteriales bacterium]
MEHAHGKGASKKGKRKLKTWQKLIIGLGIPAILILGAVMAILFYLESVDTKLAMEPVEMERLRETLAPRPPEPEEPYYVLVLGSDAREAGAASRSDTIMLCRLDPEAKRVSILSIPRDTKIELPDYGTQKINAAMAYGGPAGAVEAVSDFVGVEIAHVVMINFDGFKGIVDRLGGVTLDVPFYTSFDTVELQPGVQTLNGEQALAFARCRYSYTLGDFQRAANQRALLKAIARQIIQAPASEIPGHVNSLAECMDTDLSAAQLIEMALSFEGMDVDADMYTGQVPSTTATIDGVSYVITLNDEWATVRENYVNGTVPFVDESNQPQVVD